MPMLRAEHPLTNMKMRYRDKRGCLGFGPKRKTAGHGNSPHILPTLSPTPARARSGPLAHPPSRVEVIGMASYRPTTILKRELARTEVLLILAHIAAEWLAPVGCRIGLHLWESHNCAPCASTHQCVECGTTR